MKMKTSLHALMLFLALYTVKVNGQTSTNASAMDTIQLDIQGVEQRFVSQNLSLLAAKYDIDVAKANVLQAKLWYNPNLTYGQTLYNNGTHKLFDTRNDSNAGAYNNGEYYFQLQQLISYAGRHTNLVKLNKIDVQRAGYVFNEVLRALKLQLYTDFAQLYADQEKLNVLNHQLTNFTIVIRAVQQEVQLGAVAKDELLRLRAENQELANQSISITSDMYDAQTDLKTLLHYPANTYIKIASPLPKMTAEMPQLSALLTTATENRSDLKYAQSTVDYQIQNLKLQRSLAVPDLNIGLTYDRSAAAGYNFSGVSLSSDIPVFNRNQGEIIAAKSMIDKAKLQDTLQYNTVQNQVAGAYIKLEKLKNQVDAMDPNYGPDLESLFNNATKNYNKRYISLLEFLDQARTYSNARMGLIDLYNDYFNAIHSLNYQTGTDIIK